MTNEQRIRSLSREELAIILCDLAGCAGCPYMEDCNTEHNGAFVWLGKESED
jgi:hypothetical protein